MPEGGIAGTRLDRDGFLKRLGVSSFLRRTKDFQIKRTSILLNIVKVRVSEFHTEFSMCSLRLGASCTPTLVSLHFGS